ncbi:lipoprotein [Spiroplasma endosymbiont of Crioceris asparagi]|uniref:lipoprotein n=1 Tax=Spiroplasma endosymbiont of Crioceris asparagi TaxID=3066286 RepID=UPI0030D54F7F
MKKLIGILGSISLVATSSAVLVSCKSKVERFSTPSINRDLIKKIIAGISGNSDYSNALDLGQYYKDSDLLDKAVQIINDLLGLKNSFDKTRTLLQNLSTPDSHISNYDDNNDGIEKYKKSYDSVARNVAENKLFNEYTKSIQNDEPLDYHQSDGVLYNFNVTTEIPAGSITVYDNDGKETKNAEAIPEGSKVLFGDEQKPWEIFSENLDKSSKSGDHLPSVKDLTQEYDKGKHNFWITDAKGNKLSISSTTAVSLRFQDYFENKLINDMNETKMVMSNIFQFYRVADGNLYLNSLSPLFSTSQEWNDNNVSDAWKTNFKMVWTFQYDKTKDSDVRTALNANEIFNKISDTGLSDYTLKNDKNISNIVDALKKASDIKEINDKSAYDPYFGISGFQGYTFEKDSITYGENTLSDKYKSQVSAYNKKGAGIIYNNANQFGFDDEKDDTKCNLVIVLPIYLANILEPNKNNENEFGIRDAADKKIAINLATGKSSDQNNPNPLLTIWNNAVNSKLHSKDVTDLTTDKKTSLINQMISMLASNASIQSNAKTQIYSKYLNEKDIYYSGLWDKIGTYIHKRDDDEDM